MPIPIIASDMTITSRLIVSHLGMRLQVGHSVCPPRPRYVPEERKWL